MYFQLIWFLKRAVAEALKLQKMTVTFRHMFFTGQILDTGFRMDIFCLLTGLKLVTMATVYAWISREPNRIDVFFHQRSSFVTSSKPYKFDKNTKF